MYYSFNRDELLEKKNDFISGLNQKGLELFKELCNDHRTAHSDNQRAIARLQLGTLLWTLATSKKELYYDSIFLKHEEEDEETFYFPKPNNSWTVHEDGAFHAWLNFKF